MAADPDPDPVFPVGNPDERELLLGWLTWLRGAVLRKIDGVSDSQARWTPDGKLISLLGIVNHLSNETARHAGHADATRELLDGFTGE
jgi:hypothetical protein